MNPLVVIQARMGSSRFPGKVLAPIRNVALIERVVRACTEAEMATIVALPDHSGNGPLRSFLSDIDIPWRQHGEEWDVLSRFAAVAKAEPGHDIIVRVTADCPLIDHRTIIELVDERQARGIPYLGRCNDPDGNDVEVFTRESLLEANALCESHQREHVTTWIRQQPNAMVSLSGEDVRDVKYSVDTVEDLKACETLLRRCGEGAEWQDYVKAFRTYVLHGTKKQA